MPYHGRGCSLAPPRPVSWPTPASRPPPAACLAAAARRRSIWRRSQQRPAAERRAEFVSQLSRDTDPAASLGLRPARTGVMAYGASDEGASATPLDGPNTPLVHGNGMLSDAGPSTKSGAGQRSPAVVDRGAPARVQQGRLSESLGWVDPPEYLQLWQVLYVLRHGERTPVRRRLTTATPPLPMRWNMCHTSHRFSQAVLQQTGTNTVKPSLARIQRRVEYAPLGETPHAGELGDCLLGELTDRGRLSMLHIGRALRARYIDTEHLLPPVLKEADAERVYFRSTLVARTVQSLDQVIVGLLGDHTPSGNAFVPQVLVRDPFQEDMVPNPRLCPRLRHLMQKFERAAARLYDPKLKDLDHIVAPLDHGALPRLHAGPRLSGLVDALRSASVHGVPIPDNLQSPGVRQLMEDAVVAEWFGGYMSPDLDERRQYRRLAMEPFLSTLYGTMAQRAVLGDADPLRLAVLLGHDVSIVGLLSTLDAFDGQWPAFGAGVSLELFRDTRETQCATPESMRGFYVRCRYGDQELQLPGCQDKGRHLEGHPEMCTLDAFRDIVVARLRHPEGLTLQEECNAV